MWLPKSQIKLSEDGLLFHVVEVRDWLVKQRGVLEFTSYTEQQMREINGET